MPNGNNNNLSTFVALSPGSPTTGHWCEKCALPSQVEVPVSALIGKGVYPIGSLTYCSKHEELPE